MDVMPRSVCSNVLVAVIDTGVWQDHPDLTANVFHNDNDPPGDADGDGDPDDDGNGGDDAADALRYLLATKVPQLYVRKLRGL